MDIIEALARRTALITAYRNFIKGAQVSRLSEKLQRAGSAAIRQSAKIEARADAIIALEAEIEEQTEQSFGPHEAILGEAQRGLDDLKRQLGQMSNDPLGSSTDSPQAIPGAAVSGKMMWP